jgi:hypothetical protein
VKRLETGAALLLFALTAALYAAGAARADPGISVARSDLEVLRHWKESGRIEDLAGDPSHLPKPGYLIYLRAMLPHEGMDAGEVRRFLAVNAIAVLCGLAAAALALARRSGPRAAILFLVFGLLYLPARDSADYVGSEPLAIGLALLFFAGLVGAWPVGARRAILLGFACAPILLLRPNLGWVLLAASLVAIASGRSTARGKRVWSGVASAAGPDARRRDEGDAGVHRRGAPTPQTAPRRRNPLGWPAFCSQRLKKKLNELWTKCWSPRHAKSRTRRPHPFFHGLLGRLVSVAVLLVGFFASSALLTVTGRATGLPTNPFAVNTSKAFLWGTADYYWPSDVGGWPVGKTPEETARLQAEKTKARWRELSSRRNADMARSLLWRATHALLSCEELPSRWSDRGYLLADKLLREWWWLAATVLFSVAAALATGGSGELRFVPLLFLLASVGQGLVFGADPRLALPFIPVATLSLAAGRRPAAPRRALAAGGVTALLLIAAAVAVPDATNSDFAVLRGPGRRLEQVIAASRFPASETATLHLRLVKPDGIGLGLLIKGNGEPLYERAPEDVSATPAFLSLVLRGPALSRARLQGLKLEAATFGASRAADVFFYFPATPPVFRPACLMDGSEDLPSGYGGTTRGSVPAWIHPGLD